LLLAIAVNPALCAIGVVHAAAIAVAVVTRLAEGTRHAGVAHAVYFVLLGVVGLLCGASLQLGPGASVFSSVSLATMTLIAVADFRLGEGST